MYHGAAFPLLDMIVSFLFRCYLIGEGSKWCACKVGEMSRQSANEQMGEGRLGKGEVKAVGGVRTL